MGAKKSDIGQRLSRISMELIRQPGTGEGVSKNLDDVLVGIALNCLSHLLPVALLWVVTFTATDPMLALALTFFIHAEVRHAQGRRRALRTHAALVSHLRQLGPLRGESSHFAALVAEVSQRFHQIAVVEVFIAPLIGVGASAAFAVLIEMHVRFRLIDIVLPAFVAAAATSAWLRIADWQLTLLLPTRAATITLLLLVMPLAASAKAAPSAIGASRADSTPPADELRMSVAGPDRNSRTIN